MLLYKIAKSAAAALVGSLVFSCFMLSRVYHWFAGYIAMVLAMIFLQLFSMTLVLLGQTIAERAFTRGRKNPAGSYVAVAVALAIFGAVHDGSPLTREAILGWIPRLTGRAGGAFPTGCVWAGGDSAPSHGRFADLGTGGDQRRRHSSRGGALRWMRIIWRLPPPRASEHTPRRMRSRRGQGVSSNTISTGMQIPLLPRTFGVGPLAWRQLTGAVRTARTTLILLGLATLLAAPFIRRFLQTAALPPVLGIAGWLTLFTTNLLRFDFRGDLEQIDTLKALPLSAMDNRAGRSHCAGGHLERAALFAVARGSSSWSRITG